MKRLRITIEGLTYDVDVELVEEYGSAPAPARPASVGSASVAPVPASGKPVDSSSGLGAVASPLAGKVVAVQIVLGQQVAEGDQLLILEAMKMNTFVYAPHAGAVAEVLVAAGDAVEEGQTLIRLS